MLIIMKPLLYVGLALNLLCVFFVALSVSLGPTPLAIIGVVFGLVGCITVGMYIGTERRVQQTAARRHE